MIHFFQILVWLLFHFASSPLSGTQEIVEVLFIIGVTGLIIRRNAKIKRFILLLLKDFSPMTFDFPP